MSDVAGEFYNGVTCEIYGEIKDQDEVAFVPTTLNLTLYDFETKSVINSRSNVSLSPVSTYVNASGVLKFNTAIADMAFIDSTVREELHIFRFDITWLAGARAATFEIPILLKRKATAS